MVALPVLWLTVHPPLPQSRRAFFSKRSNETRLVCRALGRYQKATNSDDVLKIWQQVAADRLALYPADPAAVRAHLHTMIAPPEEREQRREPVQCLKSCYVCVCVLRSVGFGLGNCCPLTFPCFQRKDSRVFLRGLLRILCHLRDMAREELFVGHPQFADCAFYLAYLLAFFCEEV